MTQVTINQGNEAVLAITEALAQPSDSVEQELELFEYWNAVGGWVKIDEVRKHFGSVGCETIYKTAEEDRVPLYTAPSNREWVGLTDDEIDALLDLAYANDFELVQHIEAKLKEKNT